MKKKYQRGTDSVDARLTPREAVLNRNAAEILGRHNIAALNAHGNMLAKRGVDLASLPSDPTPGPSTENMLGYQMGTPDVMHDDTADLLREADSAFYGGGGAPPPTPTPTPIPQKYKRGTSMVRMMGYQYGTSSVDDLRNKNAAGRINRPGIINIQADPTKPGYNPISASQYIGRGGALLGSQYNQTTGRVNPLPIGAVGVQGFSQPTQSFSPKPITHTQMATDIARRNLTATGSSLGAPQPEAPIQGDPNRPSNISSSSYQAYLDQSGSTTHFLPPGFSATTGSTGAPNSAQNDIHFLPPGFSSVQGVTNPITKQLQQDQGYGSAYGY